MKKMGERELNTKTFMYIRLLNASDLLVYIRRAWPNVLLNYKVYGCTYLDILLKYISAKKLI